MFLSAFGAGFTSWAFPSFSFDSGLLHVVAGAGFSSGPGAAFVSSICWLSTGAPLAAVPTADVSFCLLAWVSELLFPDACGSSSPTSTSSAD